MDNWVLTSKKLLVNNHTDERQPMAVRLEADQVKVKVTHALVTDYDTLLYNGTIPAKYPKTIGHAGLGIVTENGPGKHVYGKAQRVYLMPCKPCGKCLACKSGHPEMCASPLQAGRDFDGFMRDIVVCRDRDLVALPDEIDNVHALCIEAVGIAEAIYDRLSLSAGNRVGIIGMGFYGNIVAQTLQYHKVIPIAVDNNLENLHRSERTGVFFNYQADDDLVDNIMNATSGRLCDAVIYCAASHLPVSFATRICAPGRTIILTSPSTLDSSVNVHELLDKQLTVTAITSSFGHSHEAIELLRKGAINTDIFEKQIHTENDYDAEAILNERIENASLSKSNKLTIIQMVI